MGGRTDPYYIYRQTQNISKIHNLYISPLLPAGTVGVSKIKNNYCGENVNIMMFWVDAENCPAMVLFMANENGETNVDTTEDRRGLRHLSLCSGYDGIGLGLERAGVDIGFTVHVEIEAFASWNLVTKIEAGALGAGVHYPDLKTFPFGKFRGCFDILSGGFPCQPFSQAGKGHGDKDPRHLFPYIRDGIEACQPAVVFLENVEGIVSAKLKGDGWRDAAGTPVLLHVIRELERLGYRATAVASSASEVGAPHQRNRWFIIGVLADSEDEGLEGYSRMLFGCDESRREPQKPARRACGSDCGSQVWPSRPGSPQHGWEPPRVVGDSYGKHRRAHAVGRDDQAEAGSAGEELADCSSERRQQDTRSTPSHEAEDGRAGRNELKQNSDNESSGENEIGNKEQLGKTEPSLGGDVDGLTCGMGYAELCESCDNRTDELRLLGNGVVPQSCTDAVIRGLQELLGQEGLDDT